jgi:hypothetical protein
MRPEHGNEGHDAGSPRAQRRECQQAPTATKEAAGATRGPLNGSGRWDGSSWNGPGPAPWGGMWAAEGANRMTTVSVTTAAGPDCVRQRRSGPSPSH